MPDYNIDLTDIRGVGPTTADTLRSEGVEEVSHLHLLATRGGATWRNLVDAGLGSDVLKHLHAVGSAVKGINGASVEAKHLTNGAASDAEFPNSLIRIDVPVEDDTDDGDDGNESDDQPAPAESDVADALATVRAHHDGEGYGRWLDFQNRIADFAGENGHDVAFWESNQFMPVIRWDNLDAETVMGYDEITDDHLRLLVAYAESL